LEWEIGKAILVKEQAQSGSSAGDHVSPGLQTAQQHDRRWRDAILTRFLLSRCRLFCILRCSFFLLSYLTSCSMERVFSSRLFIRCL
jgi:hypothetical protein